MNGKNIGIKLRTLRGDLPKESVAKAVGVSESAISMYECGRRVPKDDIKVKLSRFFGKSIEYIFLIEKEDKMSDGILITLIICVTLIAITIYGRRK